MGNQIIISISREYGSEGHTIAKQIAKDLGFLFMTAICLTKSQKKRALSLPFLPV